MFCKFYRETMQRVKELVHFGGFSDPDYLKRTLAKEFQQMELRYFVTFFIALINRVKIIMQIIQGKQVIGTRTKLVSIGYSYESVVTKLMSLCVFILCVNVCCA